MPSSRVSSPSSRDPYSVARHFECNVSLRVSWKPPRPSIHTSRRDSLPGFCPPMHNNPPPGERTTRREKIFDIGPGRVFLSRMVRERKDFEGGGGGGCGTERILIGVFSRSFNR